MRENGLYARQKPRFKRTTDSQHAFPVAPNIIDQDFAATAPDQKWGVDISYGAPRPSTGEAYDWNAKRKEDLKTCLPPAARGHEPKRR
jgi:transposase InsO family protein